MPETRLTEERFVCVSVPVSDRPNANHKIINITVLDASTDIFFEIRFQVFCLSFSAPS